MAGSHIDPDSFRDALVGIVDEIRSTVRTELGTRPYTVAVVRREWSGGRVGIGTPTVTELLLEPTPMFKERSDGRRGETGQEQIGGATLTEVSLRYTEAELMGDAGGAVEVCYRVRETGGQQQADRWFIVRGRPRRRVGDLPGDRSDWMLHLETTTPMTPEDGVDA